MFKPVFFTLQELVPQDLFESTKPADRDMLWFLFDERILITNDGIRRRFGPMMANNWHKGGDKQLRGWRPGDTKTGAKLSQHKFGRAVDLAPLKTTADEIREDILKNPGREEYRFITCMETGISWLHNDCRNWNRDKF